MLARRRAGRCAAASSLGRSGLAVADAWFSVGPAVVLIAFGAQRARLEHWWVYALALAAQLLADGVVSLAAHAGAASGCRRAT